MDESTESIEALHRRYAGVLYDKCVRILGAPAEAEDAVQETFISAFRSLSSFRDMGHGHLPWLYRIATNACLKIIRTKKRKDVPLLEDVQEVRSRSSDILEGLQARWALEQLVDHLDERGLQILVAHYIDGVDQSEIASQLGVSRRSVVKRLTRMRSMAQSLSGSGGNDG